MKFMHLFSGKNGGDKNSLTCHKYSSFSINCHIKKIDLLLGFSKNICNVGCRVCRNIFFRSFWPTKLNMNGNN